MGKISNSGKDERSQYHGGKAGDQTGEEWQIREWNDRNWNAVFRHPDAEIREMIASYAEKAAANNHIGYDQWKDLRSGRNFRHPIMILQILQRIVSPIVPLE